MARRATLEYCPCKRWPTTEGIYMHYGQSITNCSAVASKRRTQRAVENLYALETCLLHGQSCLIVCLPKRVSFGRQTQNSCCFSFPQRVQKMLHL